jgi:hypothetical protein
LFREYRIEKRKASALNNLGFGINDVGDEFSIGNAASFVYLISNTGLFIYFFVCGESILQDPNYLLGHDYSSLLGYIPKTLSTKTLLFKKAMQSIVYNSLLCLFFSLTWDSYV